jgi:uncharacterized membrane protein YphA (DoxX/SURF4 family)
MNKPTNLLLRWSDFFIASSAATQSPLLLVLRLYLFRQLFLTGKGKLANIGKVSEFFGRRQTLPGSTLTISAPLGSSDRSQTARLEHRPAKSILLLRWS